MDEFKKISIINNLEFGNKKIDINNEINLLDITKKSDEPLLDNFDEIITNKIGIFPINDIENQSIKNISSKTSLEIEDKKYVEEEYKPFHYKDRCEMIINKLILFFIHLFLISLFELIFFFCFVTKYEDKAINSVFTSITNSATSVCNNLTTPDKQIVDYIINLVVNGSELEKNSYDNYNIRNNYNYNLMINAVFYFVGVFIINIIIILTNIFYYKRKINFKGILLDNLIMITFLGIYEYLFFSTIVFNYLTITPQELEYNIYNNAIQSC